MGIATIKFEHCKLVTLMFAIEDVLARAESEGESSVKSDLFAVHSRIQQAWAEIRGVSDLPPRPRG